MNGLGSLVGAGLVFTQEWVDALKGVPESAMPASVQIWRKDGEPQYDETTNTYTQAKTIWYEGKARVQPIRNASDKVQPGDSTTVQNVLISVPIGAVKDADFRPQNQARVTVSPLNPALCKYQYVLQEIMDSSNPIERTLMFVVNQEQQA